MVSRQDLIFIFIKEENKIKTSQRIFSLISLLETLEMEGKSPGENETAIDLITSGEYKPYSMFINIEHPQLIEIIQLAREHYPNISPIIVFSKHIENITDKLNDLEKTYRVKYIIEKANVNQLTLKNLFIQIGLESCDKNCRYSYIQHLGGGASGVVDLYYDMELKRKVAVKTIRVEGMKEVDKEKVITEVANMKSIQVPTAIECYDFEIENDVRNIYMEYADGGTLESRINAFKREGGNFTTEEIFEYLIEIMLALFAMNQKGIMHRDIKSENIILKKEKIGGTEYLIAKLSDMGISRQIDGVVGSLTSCGTAYYVSPEIAAGEKRYDFNADIWSLGVVLYELITLQKPWQGVHLSTEEFIALMFTTRYPKLPDGTDPRLKYLVSIMLRKNPLRRAGIFEILKIDFVYEKAIQILKKFGWFGTIPAFSGIYELEPFVHACSLSIQLFDNDHIKLLQDANKIFLNSPPHIFKKSFIGGKYVNTRRGDDILNVINDLKTTDNAYKLNFPNLSIEENFQRLLENKIVIPLSHTESNEIEYHISTLLEQPERAFYQFSFDSSNDAMKIDNRQIMLCDPPNKLDHMALSQAILKTGRSLVKDLKKSSEGNEFVLEIDERYIKFLHGISYFQYVSLFDMNYDDTANKAPLAFLLNLYQIMYIHYIFKIVQNTVRAKSGLFSYFSNEIGVTYCFKDIVINNLELKHVVFRHNKPPPGNYMRLVYSSDRKTRILSGFNDLRCLLILYEFKSDIPEGIKFKIFESKSIEEQLNELVFWFIKYHLSYKMEELVLPSFIKNYIGDFNSMNSPEFPEDFLKFLFSFLAMHKEFILQKPYKAVLSKNESKNFDFLGSTLIKEIQVGKVRVTYQ